MILKFRNRYEEIDFLEERYKGKTFEFFVIYGRRRVGKTELIKEFLKNKQHIYLLCNKSGTQRNIDRFKRKIAEHLHEPVIASNDIEEVFSHLARKIKDKRIVIVFDEFSYLVEKDDAVSSLFQVVIDEVLKNTNIFLILCGSSISMMEKGVLSYKSPLYGRKTAHIKVMPLVFDYFAIFFPQNNMEKNIEFYSVLDGIPFYMEKFSDKKSTFDNIREQIFDKRGRLYEEIDFLLKEELREPDIYKTILDALASGRTKVVDIANKSGIKVQDIDKYLKVLIRLGIIKKEIPVTETKSKKSIYVIDDNFFSFCFSFSEPFKSDLELGETKNVDAKLKTESPAYVGKKFEKLVRDAVKRANIFQIQKVGKWWGHYKDEKGERKAMEIDIVALNEQTKEILFAECKWQEKVDAAKVLAELKEKAKHVEWHKEKRQECYAIFAKSFKKKIKEKNLFLYDLRDLERALK